MQHLCSCNRCTPTLAQVNGLGTGEKSSFRNSGDSPGIENDFSKEVFLLVLPVLLVQQLTNLMRMRVSGCTGAAQVEGVTCATDGAMGRRCWLLVCERTRRPSGAVKRTELKPRRGKRRARFRTRSSRLNLRAAVPPGHVVSLFRGSSEGGFITFAPRALWARPSPCKRLPRIDLTVCRARLRSMKTARKGPRHAHLPSQFPPSPPRIHHR